MKIKHSEGRDTLVADACENSRQQQLHQHLYVEAAPVAGGEVLVELIVVAGDVCVQPIVFHIQQLGLHRFRVALSHEIFNSSHHFDPMH